MEGETEAEVGAQQAAMNTPGSPEMDEGMKRRARMTLKFTQLRESLHENSDGTTLGADDDSGQQQTEGATETEGDEERAVPPEEMAAGDVPNWVDALAHCLTGGIAGVVANALVRIVI
eukprot:COSAG02_NODE_2424_length_8891_cov_566.577912_6_plen_118_part_00